ncbi:MAG: hypothetical protein N2689_05610 [Verrucomicrobiae bacterium]|nr:hypothetical protein [Verrucomicrobiae bacterium]
MFNDQDAGTPPQTVTVTLDGLRAEAARELVSGRTLVFQRGTLVLTLAAEDVAVLELE